MIPDKIYIHEASAPELALPRNDYHLEYIRKDTLIEWLENRISVSYGVATDALVEVIDKINSL